MDKKQNQKKLNKISAVFLLAGFGKRISDITNKPKCLLKINKKTLIDRSLNILKKLGIRNVVFVLGYKKQMIKKQIKKFDKSFNFKFAFNNDYRSRGNSFSLLKGLEKSHGDPLVFDGDLIFSFGILKNFLKDNENSSFLIGRTPISNIECAKALADEHGFIRKTIDKRLIKKSELKKYKFVGEAIGIVQIKDNIRPKMISRLKKFLKIKKNLKLNWEHFMNEFLRDNYFDYKKTSNSQWIEIDTKHDYIKAKSLFKND